MDLNIWKLVFLFDLNCVDLKHTNTHPSTCKQGIGLNLSHCCTEQFKEIWFVLCHHMNQKSMKWSRITSLLPYAYINQTSPMSHKINPFVWNVGAVAVLNLFLSVLWGHIDLWPLSRWVFFPNALWKYRTTEKTSYCTSGSCCCQLRSLDINTSSSHFNCLSLFKSRFVWMHPQQQ